MVPRADCLVISAFALAAGAVLQGCGGGDEVACYSTQGAPESAWPGSIEDGYCQDTFLGTTLDSNCTTESPCHDSSEFGEIMCTKFERISNSNETRWYLSGSVPPGCCGFWQNQSVLFSHSQSSGALVARSEVACNACAATDNEYLLKQAVPYWCQSNMSERDAPGRYAIVCDRPDASECRPGGDASSKVTEGKMLNSSIVAELDPGTFVDVLEVVVLSAAARIRGRVANPPGWISLRVTNSVSQTAGCMPTGVDRCTWALRQADGNHTGGGLTASGLIAGGDLFL